MKKFLVICGLILSIVSAQKTSDEIQHEIDTRNLSLEQLRKEIETVEGRLNYKESQARAGEEILVELNRKIDLTEKLIKSLAREERIYSEKIQLTTISITDKKENLVYLRDQMRKRMVYLYENGHPSLIEIIFLSANLNEMVYRIRYLDILDKQDDILESKINNTIQGLEVENHKYSQELTNKRSLRVEKEDESNKLESDIRYRNEVLARIKLDKSSLQVKLSDKQKKIKELENFLTRLLQDKKAAKVREDELVRIRSMQNMATTGNFSGLKGRLSWPVEGKIVSHFGTQRNTELNTVTESPGIDIRSAPGTPVKSVLDGLVTKITYLRGYGNVIIIDHGGGYQTVYANVDAIEVHEKEYIQMGSTIAHVAPNGTDEPRLHFEIYGDHSKLDPEKWLTRR